MKDKREFLAQVARSLVAAARSERELIEIVKALDDANSRKFLINMLSDYLPPEYRHRPGTRVGEYGDRAKRPVASLPDLDTAIRYMQNRGISASILQEIVFQEYRVSVPVNKVGLPKYLMRLAKFDFYEDLMHRLIGSGRPGTGNSEHDEWFEVMLSELKRKGGRDEHDK